jgi:hypothetical protein
MPISPSTLSVICAALSSDDVNATHSQIAEALAVLTGDMPPPDTIPPGFCIRLYDRYLDQDEEFKTIADAAEYIADKNKEREYNEDVSDWSAFISRELFINAMHTIKVTIT